MRMISAKEKFIDELKRPGTMIDINLKLADGTLSNYSGEGVGFILIQRLIEALEKDKVTVIDGPILKKAI